MVKPKVKTLYLVQFNLAGVLGPIKVKWDEGLESYWSADGNISYYPHDQPFEQEVFTRLKDARLFVQGVKWYMKAMSERITDNLEWVDSYD